MFKSLKNKVQEETGSKLQSQLFYTGKHDWQRNSTNRLGGAINIIPINSMNTNSKEESPICGASQVWN